MSLTINCPNCGAEVVFRSSALPARVCDYCRTMLVRNDDGVADVGKSAAVPFDVSPVQIGMRGVADSRGFEVIGRVRWAWTDGSWNEWLLLFDNGDHGWLGDAMGQFMLLKERPLSEIRSPILQSIARGRDALPGERMAIDKTEFTTVDARDVVILAAEGELPFTPRPGWRLYSVDLRGRHGECASLQREDEGTSFYQGHYVTLAELRPQGLREFEGWPMPRYA